MRNVALLLTLLAALGCNRGIDSKEAVRQGVLDYLSGRTNLNVSSMKVEVTSVMFRDNEADAVVSFAPKGATSPSQGMEMRYTLERKGNRWVVKSRADSGKSPHGAGGMSPHGGAAGDMPMPGSAAPSGTQLPPGHPSVPGTPEKK
ncbi:MAG TPA: hypothetical protein VFA33_11615 [Bryobacteraceae bacterium]|nr:hypothetical protein [Bryobacteraceae bacterium]